MTQQASHAAEIDAAAAAWLARRDAAGDATEIPELNVWLAADPRHRAAYLRLAAAWERSARMRRLKPEGEPIDPDLLKHGARGRRRPRPPWRPILTVATGAAAVLIAAVWWLASGGEDRYRTEIGGLSRIVLKDGSTVTLNTDSELVVHFNPVSRQVRLLRGEAQFSVAHEATRSFEVLAGGRLVRAVGTAFDVKLDHGQSMEVMVTDGRVALLDAALAPGAAAPELAPATVSAGEAAVVTPKKVTVRRVSAADVARRLAWQVGELSFQGETLSEAVAEFNRYNRKKLKVEDPSIAALQIGGNFQALDVESFIAALNRSFGITAASADDGTMILARAPAAAGSARE